MPNSITYELLQGFVINAAGEIDCYRDKGASNVNFTIKYNIHYLHAVNFRPDIHVLYTYIHVHKNIYIQNRF